MDNDKHWLEAVLKRKSFEESPIKIVEFHHDGGIKKGENYLSKINKIKAKVLLGSGKHKTVSLIVKNQHDTEALKEMSVRTGIFFREILMYKDILPKMANLLEEAGISTDELPWGKCIDVRLYDRLVLEDLCAEGYTMVDRFKQLGLTAALLVMTAFGKYHGLSRVLLQNGEIPLNVFGMSGMLNSKGEEGIYTENLEYLIEKSELWGDEWEEARQRLKNTVPHFGNKLKDARDPGDFPVLVHADCWTNNFLFKYTDDPEKPSSVKFLDFQICYVCNPPRDLHLFLTSSVRLEIREKHYDDLMRAYCDSLKSTLTKCNYEGYIPNLEDMKAKMEEKKIYQLADSIMMTIIALRKDEGIEFEEVWQKVKEAKEKGEKVSMEYSLLNNLSPTTEKIIKAAIKEAMKSGVI